MSVEIKKKLLVTVSGENVTDFDIMKAFMSLGLSVKIEAAPSEAAQPVLALDVANCPACQAKSIIVGTQCLVCGVFSPRK